MSLACEGQNARPAAVESGQPACKPPLVVDLDETLVATDLLIESFLALLRQEPLCLFLLPLWMARGVAYFKHQVALRVALNIATLPWRTEFVDYLRSEHRGGRSLVLATGSDKRVAEQVADHLKLFDMVLASDGITNLVGEAKRNLLVTRFGEKAFDYAADGGRVTHSDLAVWRSARNAILINPAAGVRRLAERVNCVDRVFSDPKQRMFGWLAPLRPSHWLKNLLVFVPLAAAHRFNDIALLEKAVLAFAAFGCCASGGYLFNDLIDLDADRHHPQKRFRPLAAGNLPLMYALVASPALLLIACLLSALVSPVFLAILLAYFVTSTAYSLLFKKVALLDVLFLAGLYTLRILAGSAATGLWPSDLLLAFSIFLFFSLALIKRYSELVIMRRVDGNGAKARAYELSDGELLAAMGTASGYLAVLVLALYIATDKARTLYATRELLWLLCPLLLYWISYLWLTAHRGNMPDDPVVFAVRDRTSRILILLMLVTAAAAL